MKNNVILLFITVISFFACQKDIKKVGLLVPKTVDEDATLPSLMINNSLLHVDTYGNPKNPIVIAIHGGPGDDYRSMLNVQDLYKDGYFVIFYDQIGTGLSQRVSKDIFKEEGSIERYFEDLYQIILHFQQTSNQKVFLLGHSWGAMLATGFVNLHPSMIDGLILAEPGGLNWDQTMKYEEKLGKDRKYFSEGLNDALFSDKMFAGNSEDEILDYKSSCLNTVESITGNVSSVPFWRNGASIANASFQYADKFGFDFTTHLDEYKVKILFLYSELNQAYGKDWAEEVAKPFVNKDIKMIENSGHEMIYFGWELMYPIVKKYLQ